MFVGVMTFGQIQKIMFVIVNIFWSYSNNKVCRCEIFGHILPIFSHIDSVKITSLCKIILFHIKHFVTFKKVQNESYA